MPTIFQTKDKNGRPHRNWRIKYIDYEGNRKTITGLPSKPETQKLAWKIQAEQDEIRKGLRSPPKESAKPRPFEEVVSEYLAWGKSQGGHEDGDADEVQEEADGRAGLRARDGAV